MHSVQVAIRRYKPSEQTQTAIDFCTIPGYISYVRYIAFWVNCKRYK